MIMSLILVDHARARNLLDHFIIQRTMNEMGNMMNVISIKWLSSLFLVHHLLDFYGIF
jgi:hypothetical protein